MVCGGFIWLFVFGEWGGEFGEGGWLLIIGLFFIFRVKILLLSVVNICFYLFLVKIFSIFECEVVVMFRFYVIFMFVFGCVE